MIWNPDPWSGTMVWMGPCKVGEGGEAMGSCFLGGEARRESGRPAGAPTVEGTVGPVLGGEERRTGGRPAGAPSVEGNDDQVID